MVHLHNLTACCFHKWRIWQSPLFRVSQQTVQWAPKKHLQNKPRVSRSLMKLKKKPTRWVHTAAVDAGNSDPRALIFPCCCTADTTAVFMTHFFTDLCVCLSVNVCHSRITKCVKYGRKSMLMLLWERLKMPYQATAEIFSHCERQAIRVLNWYQSATLSTLFHFIFLQFQNFQLHFSSYF